MARAPPPSSKDDNEVETCSGQFFQKTICWFNFFAIVCALSLMGVGIFIAVDRNFLQELLGTEMYSSAAYLLIILGLALCVFGFLGCCGARRENKCLVITYMIGLIVLFLLLLITAIVAIVFRETMGVRMKNGMRRSLINYYGVSQSQVITDAWDVAQWRLDCCAVENQGWSMYNSSKWIYEVNTGLQPIMPGYQYVPQSCCVRDYFHHFVDVYTCTKTRLGPPGTQTGAKNDFLHYRGCYEAGYEFLATHAAVILGLGLCIGVSLLIGIIFAFCLLRHL